MVPVWQVVAHIYVLAQVYIQVQDVVCLFFLCFFLWLFYFNYRDIACMRKFSMFKWRYLYDKRYFIRMYLSKSICWFKMWYICFFCVFLCDCFILIIEISNSCSSSPCLNGGTCTINSNTFLCTCPTLYYGNQCQYSNAGKNLK